MTEMDRQPAILYTLVANGGTPLAEYALTTGTFVEIGHRILAEKIAHEKKGKMSFQYDDFYFHYHANNGLIVLCLADKSFPRRIAFAFLEKMSESFVDTFGMETIQSADAFAFNSGFAPQLKANMNRYSYDKSIDRVASVQEKLEETKNIMIKNIDLVMERGEALHILVGKTEELQGVAIQFNRKAKEVKWKFWRENMKLWIIMAIVVIVLVWLVTSLACGFTYSSCI